MNSRHAISRSRNRNSIRIPLLAAALLLICATVAAFSQMVDLNGNGMSDVWEWAYGATNIAANADSDNDGMVNWQEAVAGTNPLNSNSVPKMLPLVISPTNVSITMAGYLGKRYQLQSVTDLGSTNWLTETGMVLRAGTNFTFASLAGPAMKYYRITISDVDSDGSGLMNDWEKYQLGLDPSNAMSNAKLDINGIPMTDYQFATNGLAQQNVITIAATDPVTTQPDPGQAPTDVGSFTISRGGFPLNSIKVNLVPGGPGIGFATAGLDYSNNLPALLTLPAGASSATILLTPLANTNLQTPVVAQLKLMAGSGYLVGSQSNAAVVVYPSSTANGPGLSGQYYTNSSTTYSSANNFNPANLITNRIDPMIDFVWGGTNPPPNLSNGLYTVRWTGQVEPQYSEAYVFDVRSDDGCRLWVNDQLLVDKWVSQGATDWTNIITLQGGTRYDLKLEYLQNGGSAQAHLYWYSADQPKQIIPNNRLFPTNSFGAGSSNAPAVVTSALSAYGFVGQPFSFTVTAANTPQSFTATNLPPGLNFNSSNGAIAGTPALAGNYQVMLTASNAIGTGASVVNIVIFDTTYSSVVQEIWTGVPGTNVADIPTSTPATLTNTLPTLVGITNYGDNYGERVRGFFTSPATGNYYFWIAGSDSAELWISNDGESVNKVRRAWVTPTNNPTAPGLNGTSPCQWNVQPSQQSGWLALIAGQKYYLEILHKAGAGTNDNWSVAWLQDPTGTNTTPAGVTPNYLLSRYYPPLPVNIPGTLYTANLLAPAGVASTGVGTATLRLSADGTQAIINFQLNNLVGIPSAESIDTDPYLNFSGNIDIFDISASHPQANGSYVWNIKSTGGGSLTNGAMIDEVIKEGKSRITIGTTFAPNGEITGNFIAANGSQIFTPPPAPPAWTEDSANSNAAARFLTQATFGASSSDIATVQALGYAGWISNQFSMPAAHHLPVVLANANPDPTDPYPSTDWFNAWWQQSITAPDQLRQRVAFALSEIMVVSENGVLVNNATALASFYDTLLDNAFGNYRSLLKAVTLTPAMGLYLNMQGNDVGSLITGVHANENYAREIEQLFSVGLNRQWPDGTLILNSQGNLVPTYNQNVVMGFASTFTGWNYYQTNQANGRLPANFNPPANYTNPMVLVPTHHERGAKLLLDNVTLPPAWGLQATSTNVAYDNYSLQDLESAMDSIYNNQNVGPFICRQLIQRLVTANPSRDYVYRVTQAFNNDGNGVRGNLQAVVSAILLDYEARSTNLLADPTYGKQREPLLRVTATARALPSPPGITGAYVESGNQTNTITTPVPHRMNSGDIVMLGFTDTSGNPAPPNQAYTVTVPNTNTFTIIVPNLLSGTYAQGTNINVSGHGLVAGNTVYLVFTTGLGTNGLYQVATVPNGNQFSIATANGAAVSGNCLLPRISASGFVQSGTNITVSCAGPHTLVTNETIYIPANAVLINPGQYQVAGIPDPLHFTFSVTNSTTTTQSGFNFYPLNPPPLTRSGNVTIQESTWNLQYTDTGSTYNLAQSPLRSPTVFNFFFPNYQFPGALASAGLTTPEFQLTSDTSVALQMNFLEGGILVNNNNTNGLSSFTGGDGDIVLDVGPWMTTNFTASANVPALVDSLNSTLVAGQLSAAAKTKIVNYVTNTVNFPFGTPPTQTQMRDRVRATVHLILCSPDFTIQK